MKFEGVGAWGGGGEEERKRQKTNYFFAAAAAQEIEVVQNFQTNVNFMAFHSSSRLQMNRALLKHKAQRLLRPLGIPKILQRHLEFLGNSMQSLVIHGSFCNAMASPENVKMFPFHLLSGCQPKSRIWIISLSGSLMPFPLRASNLWKGWEIKFCRIQMPKYCFSHEKADFENNFPPLGVVVNISVSLDCHRYFFGLH